MKPIIPLLLPLMLIISNRCIYNNSKSATSGSGCDYNDCCISNGIHKSLVGVDSVAVNYWAIDAYEYIFSYSQSSLQIHRSSNNDPFQNSISDCHIIDEFLDYIDIFFVTKSETIELSRVKGNPIVTDYPDLTFKLYFEHNLVREQSIQYGEEGYDIEYNPKFIAFFELLDSLVPTPKG